MGLLSSTYTRKTQFKKANYVKCNAQMQLTDGHMDGVLRPTWTNLQPDIEHLVTHSNTLVKRTSVTCQEHLNNGFFKSNCCMQSEGDVL